MPEAVLLMQDLPHLRTPAIYYSIPARTTFSRKRIIIRILIIIWYQHPQVASGYILVSRVSSRGGRPASHRGCSCVRSSILECATAYSLQVQSCKASMAAQRGRQKSSALTRHGALLPKPFECLAAGWGAPHDMVASSIVSPVPRAPRPRNKSRGKAECVSVRGRPCGACRIKRASTRTPIDAARVVPRSRSPTPAAAASPPRPHTY
jgi:hypothetical protein